MTDFSLTVCILLRLLCLPPVRVWECHLTIDGGSLSSQARLNILTLFYRSSIYVTITYVYVNRLHYYNKLFSNK